MAITFPKTTVVRNMRTLCERKVRGTEAVLNITRAACPFVKTQTVLSKSLKTKIVLNRRLHNEHITLISWKLRNRIWIHPISVYANEM